MKLSKVSLPFLFWITLLSVQGQAQEFSAKGGLCTTHCHGVERYNKIESPVYRHNEDVRRYNAAPNPCAYRGVRREGYPALSRDRVIFPRNVQAYYTEEGSSTHVDLRLRTDVVSQRYETVASYDATGCATHRCMTVTVYRDTYSDGRTRIWQHVGYSN